MFPSQYVCFNNKHNENGVHWHFFSNEGTRNQNQNTNNLILKVKQIKPGVDEHNNTCQKGWGYA